MREIASEALRAAKTRRARAHIVADYYRGRDRAGGCSPEFTWTVYDLETARFVSVQQEPNRRYHWLEPHATLEEAIAYLNDEMLDDWIPVVVVDLDQGVLVNPSPTSQEVLAA